MKCRRKNCNGNLINNNITNWAKHIQHECDTCDDYWYVDPKLVQKDKLK